MNKTKILGTGYYAPKKVLTNKDLESIVETTDEWIFERTGIRQRHISSLDGGEFPSDMALYASKLAIKNAQIDPETIDLILFASCTPDVHLPNTASILQTKLGLKNNCGCLDIAAACSGFVYGFNIANSLIKTGTNKTILVVGSELLSQEINWEDRAMCILFGDGAGAAILGQSSETEESDVFANILTADGTGRDFFDKKYPGAAYRFTPEILASDERFMKMQGREMFKVAVRTLANNAKAAVEKSNLTIEDVDWVVPHQANYRIIESTAKAMGVSLDKFIINIHKYGNTSAATIPIAFHEAVTEGKIKRGDIVVFDAFGAGLTAGAVVFKY